MMSTKQDIPAAAGSNTRGDGEAAVDKQLAHNAAEGDRQARARVNELVAPVIDYQSARFCKRFCNENRFRYRCTLRSPVGSAAKDASLCEWGNASYAWMLDDLTSEQRLRNYQGNNGASLFDYLYVIANSLPFYERWKDWRFDRRIHVPDYIRDMGKDAIAVFYGLRSNQSCESISQQSGIDQAMVKSLAREITRRLVQRNRLHMLDPVKSLSLSQKTDEEHRSSILDAETASVDEPAENVERKHLLAESIKKLTPIEQFIIEALVIEEQQANDVLATLKAMNICIKRGVEPSETDRQQLYYFKRKTLEKLSTMLKGTLGSD